MNKTVEQGISDIVGCLTDPIIVFPGGWGDTIPEWLKTAITMERMGAVARLKGSDSVIVLWPYDLGSDEVQDTTGAGDAFMAGVMAQAQKTPLADDDALRQILENGRLWGAYACTTLGGANSCPTSKELDDFRNGHCLLLETDCRPLDEARPILRILDHVFLQAKT